MARDDEEFSAWLTARWPDLVRSLVFLGHPPEQADRIALDALARLLPSWERLRREDDVDVELYREVMEERSRRRWTRRRPIEAGEQATPVQPGLTEQAQRRSELDGTLAALDPEDREAVVLRHVAELSEEQVYEVLGGEHRAAAGLPAEDFRFAAAAVPLTAVHAGDVRARLRERRRRGLRRGLAVTAALVLVLVAGSWATGRLGGPGGVTAAANPLPVPWYADGVLHLADLTVEVEDVEQLVAVPDGVVVADGDGDVLMVDSQGAREQIGDTVPGSPVVVDADNGWVAWADPGVGDPELVVHDTTAGEEVGRRSLAVPGAGPGQPVGDNRPIALDGERVYYRADGTDFAWEPLDGTSAFAVAGSMVDTAGGARVSRHEDGLAVQPAPFRASTVVPAVEGALTRDGRYLFAHDQFEELVVYDVASGGPIERMYSPSDTAVSWGYVDDGSFLFVVLHKLQDKQYQGMLQMPSEGDYRIYHCDPQRLDRCERLVDVPGSVAEPPLIAR